jgi:alginate O-acetyltransferase complex protein AlgJ
MKHFSTIFLLVFTAGLGILSLPALRDFRPQGDGLVNGEWALALEKHYNERLPIRDPGIHFWTAVQYALLNEGKQGLVVGRDGWLFTDEEFKTHADADTRLNLRFSEIASINQYLSNHKVTLVLALIPAKARVYSQQLGARKPDALYDSLYSEALMQVSGQRVLAPDLYQAMTRALAETSSHFPRPQLFLKTDTHWTPEGAAVAAAEIARTIASHAPLPEAGAVRFKTELADTRLYRGDLLNYLPLGPFSDWLGPTPDELKVYVTHADETLTRDSLFTDTGADIVLVGSSYSANSLWNFNGALQQALNRKVMNFASEGEGPLLPLLEYLSSTDLTREHPRILIWEFPERYLPVAYQTAKYTAFISRLPAVDLAGVKTAPEAGAAGEPAEHLPAVSPRELKGDAPAADPAGKNTELMAGEPDKTDV